MEDNLAMIFMGIVAVFLLCHFPRIFLGVHEMVIANESLACSKVREHLLRKKELTLIEVRQWQLLRSQKQSQIFTHQDNLKFTIRNITTKVRLQIILTEKLIRVTP